MSCWRLTNGGSFQLSIPSGIILQPDEYLLIGNDAKMMCATCDFKFLNTKFSLNASGYGYGIDNYSNTQFLNTNDAANGGCGCLVGSGAINNGNLSGDRLVLYDQNGTIMDAMMFANGDFYAAGSAMNINFPAMNACAPLPNITFPANTDAVFNGRSICNDLSGCNSSYARVPDGNNGAIVTWAQSGNLNCVGCLNPCGPATNTASADQPTPGISNISIPFTSKLNGIDLNNPLNNISICGAVAQTFEFEINNFTNVALTKNQATGNLGSFVKIGNANPINFTTATFNSVTGKTTLAYTFTPALGNSSYEFVWGDANTNCASCPGSNIVSVTNDLSSPEKECYVYRKITFEREEPLGGTPLVYCSLPGSITISGATGTNIKYTLQKQTTVGGAFNTIAGPQSGNSFGGVIDDDADPALPNYQVLISTTNNACVNPIPIIAAVPNSCIGNPACAKYDITGPGMPTFTPPNNTTVCAGSNLDFTVSITGVCNTGNVELVYDFDPMFDPYTQGISLGTTNTIVGATPPTTTATGKVMINEFVPRPAQGICPGTPNGQNPNSGEWIELYNAGPGSVDIGGWIIADGDWTATIPAGVNMPANSYYLIGGGGTYCSSGVLPDLNIETCNCATVYPNGQDIMNLTDANEQIALFDCSGNFIDGVLWGGGQSLPDATNNTALATGCGDYIVQKSVTLPAAGSFANSGGALSGSNEGRYRTSSNTWSTFTYGNGTPKAANPSVYDGNILSFGTQCPPPPVTASITVTMPDTCNQLTNTNFTIKAIYQPEPVAPCLKSDVVASANYTIPPCELLTLSGDGYYCDPATAPISVATSNTLVGNYIINLSNGVNNATINPATGAGPFNTTVSNSGLWTISSVTPPAGKCSPKFEGSANVNILSIPSITYAPSSVHTCYLYGIDLTSIEPQITTSPITTNFLWYSVPSGGSPINPFVFPTTDTVFYVSATTGAPANCEGSRVAVNIIIDPLPNIPTVVCDGITVTFTAPVPDCVPIPCASGVQYSANGINWSNNNVFSAADTGWAAWGSPTNSSLYLRNTTSPNCYNYVTFINPCSAPLPLTLLHFDAVLNKNQTVDLKWITSNEVNVSHFELEKKDMNGVFQWMSTTKAIGNSKADHNYDDIDLNPNIGANYYRLKSVDKDGKYTYSNVVSVFLEKVNHSISIFPNPTSSELNIDIHSLDKTNSEVIVYDIFGNIILKKEANLSQGKNNVKINTVQLSKGNYTLKVKLKDEIFVSKFTKL
ncbi:MAG: lipoprotein [Bacteroidetes bacterium OLB11]|nr:MAG: lipoprotein [Bacteroidetes bacterium OLB11]